MKKTLLLLLAVATTGGYGFSQNKVEIKPIKVKNSSHVNYGGTESGINGILTGAPNWSALNFDQGTNDILDCEAVNVPYVQNFSSSVVPGMPECTTVENAGSGNNWQTYNGTNGQFNGTYLRYQWNSSNAANSWFFTQGINLEQGISYKVSYEYGSAAGALFGENLAVAYGTDNTHTAMTNPLASHTNILSSYNKLTNELTLTPTSSGVHYFGFQSFSEADMFYLVLDNIKVELNEEGGNEDPTYCEPALDCTDNDMITNVTFQEINNTTTCSPNGFGDYTSMMANVDAGGTYPISVTVGNGWTYESVSVWIDYNNNGTFEASEFTYIGTGSSEALTGNIAIPANATEGEYRMRVRVAAVGETAATWDLACDEDQGYGETEDYMVSITAEGGNEDPIYCEPALDCSDGDLITNVTFQEINNTTTCSSNGFGDYTSMVANVIAGETHPINVTVGSGFSSESVSVWIDYNNNGTFEESEFTYVGTGSGSVVSGNIAIPANATEGEYRMRVRVAAVGLSLATWDLACDDDQGYGETEDYMVSITAEGQEEDPIYCEPELDCTDGDLITNVTFQEINNTTTCSPNGFGDYTSMVANVIAGETHPINVTVGSGFSSESVSVWIDYNNNGTFEESEFTYVGTGSGSVVSGNIAIPANATEGEYRMRVRVAAVGLTLATWDLACDDDQGYGETEDYMVSITAEGQEEDPIYCEPELDCTDNDMITNVTFQEINNTTTCSPNGFGDYTSMMANVAAGGTYPISVTVGNGWAYESVSVWIDYNNNGTFEESEFTYIGTGSAEALTGNIAIPANAAEGEFRMRVRVAAVGETTATWDMACDESQGYGETEDYMVNIGTLGLPSLSASEFAFYPNPTKDVLNIQSQKDVQSVQVLNLTGQKVMANAKITNGQINVKILPAGTYVVRVFLEGGQVETFKIIKK